MREADADWAALDAELSAWRAVGRTATLWWRDDDAVSSGSALTQLLSLTEKFSVPLTLAVVPLQAEPALAQAIAGNRNVTAVVHGYAHQNHAPPSQKPAEFGAHRTLAVMLQDLDSGITRMRELFGAQVAPICVPPWNRITDTLVPHLAQLGFRGVSTFRPAAGRVPAPGLVQTNCHIDAIDWRGQRGQRAAGAVIGELIALLRARRKHPGLESGLRLFGKPLPPGFDPEEPTGILTHHLVQSPASWQFVAEMLRAIQPHCTSGGGAKWLSCSDAFRFDN